MRSSTTSPVAAAKDSPAVKLLRSHIRQIEGFIGRIAELHADCIG